MSEGNGKPRLSPIQRDMLSILMDMKEHRIEELHKCLFDPQSAISNVYKHLTLIRKHLSAEGKFSLATHYQGEHGRPHYRLVPLVLVFPPST
jgi:hypothetical protein